MNKATELRNKALKASVRNMVKRIRMVSEQIPLPKEDASRKRLFSTIDAAEAEMKTAPISFDEVVDHAFMDIEANCGFDLCKSAPGSHCIPLKPELREYLTMCKSAYDAVFVPELALTETDRIAMRVRQVCAPFPLVPVHRVKMFGWDEECGNTLTIKGMAETIRKSDGEDWEKLLMGRHPYHGNTREMFSMVAVMICFYIRHSRELIEASIESVQLAACWINGDSIKLLYKDDKFFLDRASVLNTIPRTCVH